MVSFSCEGCGDVLTKKKLDPHRNRCHGATFTCIDCMVHFPGTQYRSHTSCMTEDQKYQGALYKNKKAKISKNNDDSTIPNANTTPLAAPTPRRTMSQQAYVEDVVEKYADYAYDGGSDGDGQAMVSLPPKAPTPPPAADGPVNVFDFLDPSATPNASTIQVVADNDEKQMVRFKAEPEAYLDEDGYMVDEDPRAVVQYGTGAIPGSFETPAPREHRRKHKDGSDVKKDKKRKRLHVDTDHIMDDAPPMLHSGLTGGINRMMRSHLPPSPDYSGGDGADVDPSPASPLKKKKHAKHPKSKKEGFGSNLMALMKPSGSKTKTKKRKVSSSSKKSSSSSAERAPKLIEFRPSTRGSGSGGDDAAGANEENQMVVFRPRADLLLSYVNKGPESERGYSMKKALRHFHRERNASGDTLGKSMEEKELWRSLRMRKNDRGEIVLFGM